MISWKYWHEFELINTFSFTIFSKYHVHKDNQSCQNILLILKINRMPYCSLFHVGQRHRVMRDRKIRFWKKHALSTIESLLMTHRLWRNIFEVFRQSLPICLSTDISRFDESKPKCSVLSDMSANTVILKKLHTLIMVILKVASVTKERLCNMHVHLNSSLVLKSLTIIDPTSICSCGGLQGFRNHQRACSLIHVHCAV